MANSPEIRVNTEDLQKKGKRLIEISGIFTSMGSRVNNQCLSVPGYDDQLGKPARHTASQVMYECKAMTSGFLDLGTDLLKVAKQFEETDNAIVEWWKEFTKGINAAINWALYTFLGIKPMEGDTVNGYKGFLAYFELSNGKVVQIWYGGESICFDPADPCLSEEEKEALQKNLNKFKEKMQFVYEKIDTFSGGSDAIFSAVLGILLAGGTAGDILKALKDLGVVTKEFTGLEEELNQMIAAYNEAQSIWQGLNASDIPGKIPCP